MIKLTKIDNFSGECLFISPNSIVSMERVDLHGMCIKKGKYPFLDENIYNQKKWFFMDTCSIKTTKLTISNGEIHHVKESAELINRLKNSI